jgi:hypothetical protein
MDGEPARFMVSTLMVFFRDLQCTSDRRTIMFGIPIAGIVRIARGAS